MYIAMGTRPDISYPFSYLHQFKMQKISDLPQKSVRLSSKNKNKSRSYRKIEIIWRNPNWSSCSQDRPSKICFEYWGGIIISEFRKRRTIALSTQKTEYMWLSEDGKEVLQIRHLLCDMTIAHQVLIIHNENNQHMISRKMKLLASNINIIKDFISEKIHNSGKIIQNNLLKL